MGLLVTEHEIAEEVRDDRDDAAGTFGLDAGAGVETDGSHAAATRRRGQRAGGGNALAGALALMALVWAYGLTEQMVAVTRTERDTTRAEAA